MSMSAMAQDLDRHRWKERLILLYTPGLDNKTYQDQMEDLLRGEKGLDERKVKVYTFLPHHFIAGLGSDKKQHGPSRQIPSFAIELIGLDGGRKFFSEEKVTSEALFALIDRMPMRRREMDKGQR